jgi:hypothetical protein
MTLRYSLFGLVVLLMVSGMASLSTPAEAPEVSRDRGLVMPAGPARSV